MTKKAKCDLGQDITSTAVGKIETAIFKPRSVAVIGASSDKQKEMGGGWVGRLVQYGYPGKIYPINPTADKVLDIKAYPSVGAVPGDIDFVTLNIPASAVYKATQECIAKGVKVIHCFSAGFAEGEKEGGKSLQDQVAALVRGSGTRFIGPNCVGVYSPEGVISFDIRLPKEKGNIGFCSQSGVGGRHLLNLATERGLRISKAISYGNAIDLDGPDFLEYFALDPDTKYILTYTEGLKQGQRFFNALQKCTAVKPVVIVKGGLSESGAGAVASHTASLSGSRQVWQALFHQTGVIKVDSFEEAVEQLVAVVNIPKIGGKGVALVGRGGGFGVIATDMCEANGLKVPKFADETRQKLSTLVPDTGSSIRNPVEIGLGRRGLSENFLEGIKTVAADPKIDVIIAFFNPEDYVHYGIGDWVTPVSKGLVDCAKAINKPFVVSFLMGRDPKVFESIMHIQDECQKEGIACYSSLESAIKAISKLAAYYEFRDKFAGSDR